MKMRHSDSIATRKVLDDGGEVEVQVRPWRNGNVLVLAQLTWAGMVKRGYKVVIGEREPLPKEFSDHPDVQRATADALEELQRTRLNWLREGAR